MSSVREKAVREAVNKRHIDAVLERISGLWSEYAAWLPQARAELASCDDPAEKRRLYRKDNYFRGRIESLQRELMGRRVCITSGDGPLGATDAIEGIVDYRDINYLACLYCEQEEVDEEAFVPLHASCDAAGGEYTPLLDTKRFLRSLLEARLMALATPYRDGTSSEYADELQKVQGFGEFSKRFKGGFADVDKMVIKQEKIFEVSSKTGLLVCRSVLTNVICGSKPVVATYDPNEGGGAALLTYFYNRLLYGQLDLMKKRDPVDAPAAVGRAALSLEAFLRDDDEAKDASAADLARRKEVEESTARESFTEESDLETAARSCDVDAEYLCAVVNIMLINEYLALACKHIKQERPRRKKPFFEWFAKLYSMDLISTVRVSGQGSSSPGVRAQEAFFVDVLQREEAARVSKRACGKARFCDCIESLRDDVAQIVLDCEGFEGERLLFKAPVKGEFNPRSLCRDQWHKKELLKISGTTSTEIFTPYKKLRDGLMALSLQNNLFIGSDGLIELLDQATR